MTALRFPSNVALISLFTILFFQTPGQGMPNTLYVSDNIYIAPDDTMVIDAGQVVMFTGYYNIIVDGTLIAEGTVDAPITFTVNDTLNLHDTQKQTGAWNGIRFAESESVRSENNLSVFRHCVFEYSKATSEDFGNGGVFSITGGRQVIIEDCFFRHNYSSIAGGAVYINGASPQITRSSFVHNTAHSHNILERSNGGAVHIQQSEAEISYCYFEKNRSIMPGQESAYGGAISVIAADPQIFNNIIYDNYAPLGGGIGFLMANGANPISNNLVIHNAALLAGGGLSFIGSSPVVSNNTVLYNHANSHGGGIFMYDHSAPVFYNCIFRYNSSFIGNELFVWDLSNTEFYHSNIEGGFDGFEGGIDPDMVFVNNIDEDPLFSGDENHPYSLNQNSPCIDAGYEDSESINPYPFDLAGNPRLSGSAMDIGAYEYQGQAEDTFSVLFVLHNEFGDPVENAVIELNGVANVAGDYLFDDLLPGTYSFTIFKTCYADYEDQVIVISSDVDVEVILDWIPGDVNGDQLVNVMDIITLANHFVGFNPQPFCFENADANADGVVNVLDAILITHIFSSDL